MRAVVKGAPPGNVSPAGQTPRSLPTAAKQLQASLATVPAAQQHAHARAAFDDLDKAALRKELYAEQHHLCVYCEGRVHEKPGRTDDPRTPHIEHWEPIDQAHHRALDWDNLYLSCPNPETCDGAKDKQPLGVPPPVQVAYERCVGVTSLGTLYVRTDAPLTAPQRAALTYAIGNRDPEVPSIVNLNAPTLREARVAAMDGERERLARAFPARTASPEERHAIAGTLLGQAKRDEYVSTRVAYLTRTMGKAQP